MWYGNKSSYVNPSTKFFWKGGGDASVVLNEIITKLQTEVQIKYRVLDIKIAN